MFDIFAKLWWQYLLLAICCYAFCNVNFAIVFSKLFKKSDVRDYGSGNAGTTNMFRVYGLRMGALTFLCDTMKGVACCLLAKLIFGWSTLEATTAGYIAGLFAVLGHVFPVYYRFRGGKGVATSIGALFSLQPILGLCLVVPFCLAVLLSDRMSVGSLLLSIFMIVWSWIVWSLECDFGIVYNSIDAFCCLLITVSYAVVIFAHRSNIVNIFTGKETRIGLRKALRGKSDKIVK
ncbi:MAG: glycerol-3-phosphate 1-O-acyltransferase PlsY [Clostridiales bacterium]|nr:glycerol-3-phosphate 1-O-acyltransferase PlsY [Clostridiales bacterium]